MGYDYDFQTFIRSIPNQLNFSNEATLDFNRTCLEKTYDTPDPIHYIYNPKNSSAAILYNITTDWEMKKENNSIIASPLNTSHVLNSNGAFILRRPLEDLVVGDNSDVDDDMDLEENDSDSDSDDDSDDDSDEISDNSDDDDLMDTNEYDEDVRN